MAFTTNFTTVKFFGKDPLTTFKKDIASMAKDYKDDPNFNKMKSTLNKNIDSARKIINGITEQKAFESTSKKKNVLSKFFTGVKNAFNVAYQQTNLPKTKQSLITCFENCENAIGDFEGSGRKIERAVGRIAGAFFDTNRGHLSSAKTVFENSAKWVKEDRIFAPWGDGSYWGDTILRGTVLGNQPEKFVFVKKQEKK
ncbi:MAG: hypothetical protein LBR79_01750 [Oscillospiraceae bacterium]|jgi:hypothetical protein|nr:hypothetical protein [Oscillospiraceae bacterium]